MQQRGDAVVRPALGDVTKNLEFASGEPAVYAVVRMISFRVCQPLDNFRIDRGLPGEDSREGIVDELDVARHPVLYQISLPPGVLPEEPDGVSRLRVCGQDKYAHLRERIAQSFRGGQPAVRRGRHGDVEYYRIWP